MGYPVEFVVIVPVVKKILKQKKMTYRDLAKRMHMSEANVKKVMVAKDCSLKRLNQICEALDLSLSELLEVIQKRPVQRVALNKTQQDFLASDENNLLLYFKLAFEGVSFERAQKDLRLSEVQFRKKLLTLEAIGLLKTKADGKTQAPDEHLGIWPHEGPAAKILIEEWSHSLLRVATRSLSDATNGDFTMRYLRLSEKSAKEFRDKMLTLINDFDRISNIEMKVHPTLQDLSVLYATVPESLSNIRLKAKM